MSEWNKFKKKKIFHGTKQDLIDGYIHFSNKNQIKKTLKKHYFKKKNLILLTVDTLKLKNLVWEKSNENILFPHLYSYLNLKNIKNKHKIFLKENGTHTIVNFIF